MEENMMVADNNIEEIKNIIDKKVSWEFF
jgi:hypothetical protein